MWKVRAVCPSESTAKSVSRFRIRGWSTKYAPKACLPRLETDKSELEAVSMRRGLHSGSVHVEGPSSPLQKTRWCNLEKHIEPTNQSLEEPSPCPNPPPLTETSRLHHLDDCLHAIALGANHLRPRPVVLDLTGRIRPVRELVFEAHYLEPSIARFIRQPARHDKAREGGGTFYLREGKEGVAHGGGGEPLWR